MATTRGALIEYSDNFFGPIPNVVLFQFNPEQLSRRMQSSRPTTPSTPELDQAGERPVEHISLTIHFDASDRLADDDPIARAQGVGPALAALEQMVRPTNLVAGLIGKVVDEIGSAISGAAGAASVPVPREKFPRVLFVWGIYRVLPVIIDSLSITETKFDYLLNPTRAEVELSMAVVPPHHCSDDLLGKGAFAYSAAARESMAAVNLGNVVRDVIVGIESLIEEAG